MAWAGEGTPARTSVPRTPCREDGGDMGAKGEAGDNDRLPLDLLPRLNQTVMSGQTWEAKIKNWSHLRTQHSKNQEGSLLPSEHRHPNRKQNCCPLWQTSKPSLSEELGSWRRTSSLNCTKCRRDAQRLSAAHVFNISPPQSNSHLKSSDARGERWTPALNSLWAAERKPSITAPVCFAFSESWSSDVLFWTWPPCEVTKGTVVSSRWVWQRSSQVFLSLSTSWSFLVCFVLDVANFDLFEWLCQQWVWNWSVRVDDLSVVHIVLTPFPPLSHKDIDQCLLSSLSFHLTISMHWHYRCGGHQTWWEFWWQLKQIFLFLPPNIGIFHSNWVTIFRAMKTEHSKYKQTNVNCWKYSSEK